MSIYRNTKSNATLVRELLARAKNPMTVDEITAALSDHGLTKKQVKDACFEMCKDRGYAKRAWLVKCGSNARQSFKLALKPRPATFNVSISPAVDIPVEKPTKNVESVEEWAARTGLRVERLPIGASAFPLRTITA